MAEVERQIREELNWVGPIYKIAAISNTGTAQLCEKLLGHLEVLWQKERDNEELAEQEHEVQLQMQQEARERIALLQQRHRAAKAAAKGRALDNDDDDDEDDDHEMEIHYVP